MIRFLSLIQVWWHAAEHFLFKWHLLIYWCPNCSCTFQMWTEQDLNRFRNSSLSINMNALKMSPTIWFVFFTLLLICSVKFNLLSKDTPRSFPLCTFSMGTLPFVISMVYAVSSILIPICRWWHFCQMLAHMTD